MFGEPTQTQYDLRFQVFGIPVRVHPLFWLVALIFGLGGSSEPIDMVIWIGVVFLSVLIHELGHALTARYFGCQPWITLYGMGGLASFQPRFREAWKHVVILLAGPGAGFLLAAIVIGLVVGTGATFSFFGVRLGDGFTGLNPRAYRLVFDLLFVNIFWGLVNLFPVFPLDGGQIARHVLVSLNPWQGIRQSLWLSVFAGALLALFALQAGMMYMGLLFGWMAFNSYQALQGPGNIGRWY